MLRADNRGEGGIFALYALVRRHRRWLVLPAMIGGAALLADGIITPPISITSAVEGLQKLPAFGNIKEHIVYIVLVILALFFFLQQFGTASIGKFFGPIMTIWFTMLAILGVFHIFDDLSILRAFSPTYAVEFVSTYPNSLWLLGAVFFCTTGAEAFTATWGIVAKRTSASSWIFVKTCLILNYLGQGASLLAHHTGLTITAQVKEEMGINAFYDLMPQWFIFPGVIIATTAAIIASQAMISGSFTLISEAMRLNLWPKLKIRYPSEARGQLFIPSLNLMMFIGCIIVVLYFRTSRTDGSGLWSGHYCYHAHDHRFVLQLPGNAPGKALLYLDFSGAIPYRWNHFSCLRLLQKFTHGGYITVMIGGLMFLVMYVWFRARKIKNRYVEFVRLEHYIPKMQELSNDRTVPKYATHLVYLTSADNPKEIEHKIIYSILNRKPKRADIYWFIHVDTLDEPYTMEYKVDHIIPNDIIRVEFRLGFRVEPRINLMFRKVVEDLVANKEVNITSRYESLERSKIVGDFQFIVMEKYLSQDNDLPIWERMIMKFHFWLKDISLSEERGFGLDTSTVTIEKFPLIVSPVTSIGLKRLPRMIKETFKRVFKHFSFECFRKAFYAIESFFVSHNHINIKRF